MGDEPDYSGHAMVALYPGEEFAGRFAIPGGTAPDKLHVTMCYLGVAEEVDEDAVVKALKSLPVRQPFTATISGHARFTGGEDDVLVALVDAPEIEQLRIDLLKALAAQGVVSPSEHGFTPHMTLAYMDAQALMPIVRLEPEPVEFGSVWLKHGKTKTAFPFGSEEKEDPAAEAIRPYARTAYAQGWAATGGPMTDRVKAGCLAAVDFCCEHADDPGVLEVAIHLGQLEGVWATVFARRFKLMADMTNVLTPIWRKAMKSADIEGTITALRQRLGLAETDDAAAKAKTAARELAMRMLSWIPATAEWQEMRTAMQQLIASGRAEGYADAIAIAGAEADVIGLSFDIAFKDAYAAMVGLGDVWAESDVWLERMLGRAAIEFGRTLGELAASGATYEDMVAAATEVLDLTAEDADAVEFTVDWALSAGFSRGALDLYRSEGVQQVTWMTAGDSRVCPVCELNEADSPFLITDFPDMPAHPRCRCVASAEFSLTGFSDYFGLEAS